MYYDLRVVLILTTFSKTGSVHINVTFRCVRSRNHCCREKAIRITYSACVCICVCVFAEELNDLYSSPNIVWVIKSRRMRWVGHVARMGEEGGCIGSWWGNRRERDHWGDLGVDGWIILGWISRRWDVGMWTGLDWHRIETGGVRL